MQLDFRPADVEYLERICGIVSRLPKSSFTGGQFVGARVLLVSIEVAQPCHRKPTFGSNVNNTTTREQNRSRHWMDRRRRATEEKNESNLPDYWREADNPEVWDEAALLILVFTFLFGKFALS